MDQLCGRASRVLLVVARGRWGGSGRIVRSECSCWRKGAGDMLTRLAVWAHLELDVNGCVKGSTFRPAEPGLGWLLSQGLRDKQLESMDGLVAA